MSGRNSRKEFMKRNCASGYDYYESKFYELKDLLTENAAYSNFKFADGVRGKDNIIGGTKFVVLDIDKSRLTDLEAHVLLDEYNHHIARTSDSENAYKFRVLIELDAIVDIKDNLWACFMEEIGDHLGLVIDILPKSQIYFSFASKPEDVTKRVVHSQLRASPMAVKPLLDKASNRLRDKPRPVTELPVTVKKTHLEDPRTTFEFAFSAEQGERSRKMYRALAYAIDLGADKEYLKQLASEINNYWVVPMDETRLQNTLLTPALRRI